MAQLPKFSSEDARHIERIAKKIKINVPSSLFAGSLAEALAQEPRVPGDRFAVVISGIGGELFGHVPDAVCVHKFELSNYWGGKWLVAVYGVRLPVN